MGVLDQTLTIDLIHFPFPLWRFLKHKRCYSVCLMCNKFAFISSYTFQESSYMNAETMSTESHCDLFCVILHVV